MLIHLQLRDFAIVDYLELDFAPGMSVLTGETGAGKSIIVDALGLLLGDRGDSTVVRHGAERTEISAVFDLGGLPAALDWLKERDLDSDVQCHVRRVINRGGRSRAYIGGTPQPLQQIKEFGELLIDIHGQHEHQSLLRRDAQRQLLDDHADNQKLLDALAGHYRHWNEFNRRLAALREAAVQREARLDLLRFQVQELQALNYQSGEMATLEVEHKRLAHAGRLQAFCQQALQRLYDDDTVSVQGLLSQTLQELDALLTVDPRLTASSELLNAALIQVQEASDELRHYGQTLDLDPDQLTTLEQRLADIHRLVRKHRVETDELPALLAGLAEELDRLENSEVHEAQLERERDQARRAYDQQADRLSERREAAAQELAERVSAAMQTLGMPGGCFSVTLERLERPAAFGCETVEFWVSANPGQPLKPLSRVASGGELSRISLALQVIAARNARIPTLIFDEVDSGIGGAVAEMVGRQLRALGEQRQVLCVTHLPQVAALGHHQLKVDKQTDGHSTRTAIEWLDDARRIEEIARMLGGVQVTEQTRAHARELVEGVATPDESDGSSE
ncbi:MAG: DNA repair protein RecN [Gammaproteobacteria bacterium]|nr:DNA repair protein RecN [Gammaproteobacteria bacterium]MCP5424329.1 DNA repair protein RecN [Gammaproteobacteria bacterium]MCP5459083.1 DNA repair protein RecN [Gammaproteobacteria bacterium]